MKVIWEGALLAPTLLLDNLTIIDYNKWQATGRSQEVTSLEPCQKNGSHSGGVFKRLMGTILKK